MLIVKVCSVVYWLYLFVYLSNLFSYWNSIKYSSVVKSGFYEKLECELQGFQNTYYVGGLMAFELTERNSSYAMAMVCKHFTTDNSMLIFPYVKVIIFIYFVFLVFVGKSIKREIINSLCCLVVNYQNLNICFCRGCFRLYPARRLNFTENLVNFQG